MNLDDTKSSISQYTQKVRSLFSRFFETQGQGSPKFGKSIAYLSNLHLFSRVVSEDAMAESENQVPKRYQFRDKVFKINHYHVGREVQIALRLWTRHNCADVNFLKSLKTYEKLE